MHNDVLENLYNKYYKTAYLYTYSLCHHREIAEDIVNQAFENAFLTLEDEYTSFIYWILKVCKNLWIDYIRKNKRLLSFTDNTCFTVGGNEPLDSYLQREGNQKLYTAIQKLPENYREILSLHYFSEISLSQIATMLGDSRTNVKTKLHRGRLRLKKFLEEDGYEF